MNKLRRLICLFLSLSMVFSITGCGNSRVERAVLLYIIGSDLETQNGCASEDLNELLSADQKDIPVLIQVGGAKKWHNDWKEGRTPQRFTLKDGAFRCMETLPDVSMADPATLIDFLRWAKKACPARNYDVIFWDHGGGTALGFGCDEFHPYDTISISDFRDAFQSAGFQAEMIGFDACLMGTLETASALADCADYLIASEETEPTGGWYYTDWLTSLSQEPQQSMEQWAKMLIDRSAERIPEEENFSLALIDTKAAQAAQKLLSDYFLCSIDSMADVFPRLASARCRAAEMGEGGYDQIDLMGFLNDAEADEELLNAVSDAVLYSVSNIPESGGLAFYYPFRIPESYAVVRPQIKAYQPFYDAFLSVVAYGRSFGDGPSIPSQLTGYEDDDFSVDLTRERWYSDKAGENGYRPERSLVTEHPLELSERLGELTVSLDEEQQEMLSFFGLELWAEDEDNYLLVGQLPAQQDTSGVHAPVSRSWLTLDGEQMIPFNVISQTENGLLGYSLATLNRDDDIELLSLWNGEEVSIKGYRFASEDEELSFPTRELLSLDPGDRLDFFCPSFSKGGYYNNITYVGDTVTVTEETTLSVTSFDDAQNLYAGFHLTDLYGRSVWTKPYLVR